MSEQWIDIMLYGSYILIGVAVVVAVVGNLYNATQNPKSLIKSGIGIGVLAIIFFASYSAAPAELDGLAVMAFEANDMDPVAAGTIKTYKFVGAAMTTTLVLLVLALAGLVFSSIARIVK